MFFEIQSNFQASERFAGLFNIVRFMNLFQISFSCSSDIIIYALRFVFLPTNKDIRQAKLVFNLSGNNYFGPGFIFSFSCITPFQPM